MQQEYPYNLFESTISGAVKTVNAPDEITLDVMLGLQYALSQLKGRERIVLEMRYQERKTLMQIGAAFCVSASRVRQIEISALRRLRKPENWKFVQYGIKGILKLEARNAYKQGFDDGYEKGYANGVNDLQRGTVKDDLIQKVMNIPIDELGLSGRAYKCLLFSGCKTIGDVAKMDRGRIDRIRNFGVVSRLEVQNALHSYNIYDTDWEERKKSKI